METGPKFRGTLSAQLIRSGSGMNVAEMTAGELEVFGYNSRVPKLPAAFTPLLHR